MTLRPRTLLQMARENAASGRGTLLRFVSVSDDDRLVDETIDWAQVLGRASQLAGALRAAGLAKGDRFGLLMRNRPEFVIAMVASEMAETQFVSIDPRIRGKMLASMLAKAGCRGVIGDKEGLESLGDSETALRALDWVWSIDVPAIASAEPLKYILTRADPLEGDPAQHDAVMQLIYTSSTTGDAKAIMVTYKRFAEAAALAYDFCLRDDDVIYSGLSLTHANAQYMALGCAAALDIPLVISRKFTKSRLWEILRLHGCTVFNLLGGMTSAIYAEPQRPGDRDHRVRMVISAGMPANLWRRFEDRFGLRVFEFYGTAEGGLLLNPPGTGPVGSVGRPPEGLVCAVLGPEDEPCDPTEKGELCFRSGSGEVLPVDYLDNADAAAQKVRGGWFRTADIGWIDDAGWYYFSHRAGRSVRRNGDFIDTSAIEAFLANVQGVDDVYVYGVRGRESAPGERWVVAAVESDVSAPDPSELLALCLSELGSLSVPDYIQAVPAIPKTISEKPQDRKLVDMINEGISPVFDRNGEIKIEVCEGRDDNA